MKYRMSIYFSLYHHPVLKKDGDVVPKNALVLPEKKEQGQKPGRFWLNYRSGLP